MQKMKVFFIKMKMRNEMKKYFLKMTRAYLKVEIRESALTHFFKSCLITMHNPQWAFTSSKLTIETLEQGVKYVQS